MNKDKNFNKLISLDNHVVKKSSSLKNKKYRKMYGLVVIEGEKMINEALATEQEFHLLFVEESKSIVYQDLINKIGCKTFFTNEKIIDKISNIKTSSGILAIIKVRHSNIDINDIDSDFLVLDRIQDPGNLGAIIRSAVATNFTNIVLIDSVDLYNDKVIRGSAGTVFKIKHYEISTQEFLNSDLSSKHLIALQQNAKNIFNSEIHTDKPIGIVVGNEGSGIRDEIAATLNDSLSIPMNNDVESLNATVSASIAMYYLNIISKRLK